MNKKDNQRSQLTELKIIEVFTELLSQKHISKISVCEICKKAGITRASFYLHHEDIYDLLRKIERENISSAMTIFKEAYINSNYDLHTAFMNLFTYIENHRDFFQYYLKNADIRNILTFGDLLDSYNDFNDHDKNRLVFFIGGLNALLIQWLENDCSDSLENILEAIPKEYAKKI